MEIKFPDDDNNETLLDWDEVRKQISESDDPSGPIQLIRSCLDEVSIHDSYDKIEKSLDNFIEDLQKRLTELSR